MGKEGKQRRVSVKAMRTKKRDVVCFHAFSRGKQRERNVVRGQLSPVYNHERQGNVENSLRLSQSFVPVN